MDSTIGCEAAAEGRRIMSAKRGLEAYRERRDFRKSPEPQGGTKQSGSEPPIFVIHKHDATNLHYDLRLEVGGVLKSWAVAKGPSTDPREKRLAIATEDHPLEYADFEGVIPEGEYGAGAVLVWDAGTYTNLRAEKAADEHDRGDTPAGESMDDSLEEGKVEVRLQGEKLRGGYALIRTDKGKKERWLLIKMKDEGADARRNPASTEPKSVISGRTLEQIASEAREEAGDGDS
jgi:DNA ligase D-like protein (predicted 3'-phosphoesterase)